MRKVFIRETPPKNHMRILSVRIPSSPSGGISLRKIVVAVFLILLSTLTAVPSLNTILARAQSSDSWSFRDDFNYSSIDQLQAAGWTTGGGAPPSYFNGSNGILTLLDDGYVGAAVEWNHAPAGVTNWSVSLRGRWIGNPVGSIALGVRTAGHSYSFLADGYYVPDPLGQCSCVRTNPGFGISDDGRGVARFPGYSPELDTWHVLRVDMVQGTLYTYFDGVLVGDFTEFDTSAGNTNLAGIEVGAPWFANVEVDWMQASGSPSTPPTNPYFMVAGASSVTVLPGQNVSDPFYVSSLGRFEGTVNLAAVATPSSGLSVTMDTTVTVWVGEPKESTLYVAIQSTTMVEQSFTITVTATSGNLSTSVTINVNGLTDHNPIVIHGDTGFTIANGVTGGSGTFTDPYVIQGWAISTDFLCCASPGIVISDTKAYFTIDNVYINNPGSDGIELANVQNGVIKDSAMNDGVACYGSPDSCSNPDGVDITSSSNVKLLRNEFGRAISNLYGDAGHLDASISSSMNVTLRGNRFDASGIDLSGSPAQLSSYNINPYPSTYTYDVDPSLYNLVNGQPLYYYTDCSGLTVDGVSVGQLIIANCRSVRVSNLRLSLSRYPLKVMFVNGATISDNTIDGGTFIDGLSITHSSNLMVTGNSISDGFYQAYGESSGIELDYSTNVIVAGNNISYTHIGMQITGTNQSAIYHNNFIQNDSQAYQSNTGITWDDGYPIGGNYWSDYGGSDPDNDGIGDTIYSVCCVGSVDRYPLMKPFTAQTSEPQFHQTLTFDGVIVSVSGNFTPDTTSKTVNGTVSIIVTNSTTSQTVFSKTYTVSVGYGSSSTARFVLTIPTSSSWLGAACTVNISSNNASCSVSRDPDVNDDGAINILDLALIAISYGSKMGGPGYNVSHDLNADGKVTILDLALAAIEYQLPVFN